MERERERESDYVVQEEKFEKLESETININVMNNSLTSLHVVLS